MRLSLAAVAFMVIAGPALADSHGLTVKVDSFNRDNAAHTPTVIFTLNSGSEKAYSAVYVECTALDGEEKPLEVLQSIVNNLEPQSAVHQQAWFLTTIPKATHTTCRVGLVM